MLVSPVLVFVRDFSANVILEYISLIGNYPTDCRITLFMCVVTCLLIKMIVSALKPV